MENFLLAKNKGQQEWKFSSGEGSLLEIDLTDQV